MKNIIACISLLTGWFTPAFSQHYSWSCLLVNGIEWTGVHPDTIRNDSIVFSTPEGVLHWARLDSLHSLTYEYNPTDIALCVMGGIVGCSGRTSTPAERIVGGVLGVASGFLLSSYLGKSMGHEEIILEGMDPAVRRKVIRERTAHWTGRVVVVQ